MKASRLWDGGRPKAMVTTMVAIVEGYQWRRQFVAMIVDVNCGGSEAIAVDYGMMLAVDLE